MQLGKLLKMTIVAQLIYTVQSYVTQKHIICMSCMYYY